MPERLITIFFCLLLCIPAWAAKQPSESDLQKLKKDIRAAEERLQSNRGEETTLQKGLRKTETKLGQIEKGIAALKKTINARQKQLTSLNREAVTLKAKEQQQKEQIIAQINASYRMGRENRIKIMLNQEDPQQLSRLLAYSDYFNHAHTESIEQYKATLGQIEQNRLAIENKNRELVANKDSMVDQQKELESSLHTRKEALAKLKSSIKGDKDKLRQLEQDRQQLEALLRSVNASVAGIKLAGDSLPFNKAKGSINWPTKGKLENRFGQKRPPGDMLWQGISFFAAPGNEVRAVHHGRVIFADWFRGKGLLMIIDHGDGYMTLYAHNQSLLRETGDWVSAGEQIASVGNSGGLDHYELYFEIRHLGEPLNPRYWLKQKG